MESINIREILSEREFEVMALVSIGLYNKEIAFELNCKLCTIKKHLQHIFPKLKVHNRTEATVKFLKLVDLPDQPTNN
jgi:DNA-binding NarL/FixJ family response regulator